MSNLQNYEQVFQIDISLSIADEILNQLENTYAAGFHKNFGHISDDALRMQVCTTLSGITPIQLQSGLDRMKRETNCPKSISEFRNWCEGDSFWTANHAWAIATTYLDYPKTEITVFAKRALDSVRLILSNEGQKSAGYAFRDIYVGLVSEARSSGQKQEMWNRKKELPAPPKVLSISKSEAMMSETDKQIIDRQRELMNQGISPKEARKQAQAEIKDSKPALINKAQDKSVLLEPKKEPVLTPFQKLIAEGKSAAEAFKICKGATA